MCTSYELFNWKCTEYFCSLYVHMHAVCSVYVSDGVFLNTLCRRRFMRRSLSPFGGLAAAVRSCEAPRLLHGSSLLIKEARCADTGEQHPYKLGGREYKQNLSMDNTRAFVIFQNPTYPPPRSARIRRCSLASPVISNRWYRARRL